MEVRNAFLLAACLTVFLAGCSPTDDDDDNGGGTTTDDDAGVITPPPALATPNPSFPSTGIPDQDSFSLAATVLNVEGNFDGESSEVSVRLADHLNNTPVPDGTLVWFTTEGGRIDPFCETTNGTCSVNWESSNPRPDDGLAEILAWTVGNESFVDLNSNGLFDDGDLFDTSDFHPITNKDGNDVPEGFRDDNHDRVYDAATEEFPAEHPHSNNGTYNAGDDLFNGVNCAHSTLCSPNQSVTIWNRLTITMAESFTNAANVALQVDGVNTALGSTVNLAGEATVDLIIAVADTLGNAMASGTSIALTANNGSLSVSTFTYPNQGGVAIFRTQLKGDTTSSSGSLVLIATSPKGRVSPSITLLNVDD